MVPKGCELISGEGWEAGMTKEEPGRPRDEGWDAGSGATKRARRRRRKLPEIPKDKKRKIIILRPNIFITSISFAKFSLGNSATKNTHRRN